MLLSSTVRGGESRGPTAEYVEIHIWRPVARQGCIRERWLSEGGKSKKRRVGQRCEDELRTKEEDPGDGVTRIVTRFNSPTVIT